MMRRSLVLWERRRKNGLLYFVLMWGVVRCGSVFLICSFASISLSNWLFNRRMAQAGVQFEVKLADLAPFLPRLLVIVFGGGALLAIALWYYMEAAYRRAQSSARA